MKLSLKTNGVKLVEFVVKSFINLCLIIMVLPCCLAGFWRYFDFYFHLKYFISSPGYSLHYFLLERLKLFIYDVFCVFICILLFFTGFWRLKRILLIFSFYFDSLGPWKCREYFSSIKANSDPSLQPTKLQHLLSLDEKYFSSFHFDIFNEFIEYLLDVPYIPLLLLTLFSPYRFYLFCNFYFQISGIFTFVIFKIIFLVIYFYRNV